MSRSARFQAFPSPCRPGGSKGCLRRLNFMWSFATCFALTEDGQPVNLVTNPRSVGRLRQPYSAKQVNIAWIGAYPVPIRVHTEIEKARCTLLVTVFKPVKDLI